MIAFKFGEGVAFASPVKVDSGSNTDLDLSLTGGIIPGAGPSSVSSEPVNVESTSLEVKSNDPVITPTKANGVITGTITNQNSNPIAFVRVIAVGDPGDPNTQLGFTITHLLFGGIGYYSMNVPAGRYLFIRAAKLPLYLGAWAGPVSVEEGQTVTLDLSITYIGPDNLNTVVLANQVTGLQIQGTQSEPTNI